MSPSDSAPPTVRDALSSIPRSGTQASSMGVGTVTMKKSALRRSAASLLIPKVGKSSSARPISLVLSKPRRSSRSDAGRHHTPPPKTRREQTILRPRPRAAQGPSVPSPVITHPPYCFFGPGRGRHDIPLSRPARYVLALRGAWTIVTEDTHEPSNTRTAEKQRSFCKTIQAAARLLQLAMVALRSLQ